MKRNIPFELKGKPIEIETTTWSDFYYGGKAAAKQKTGFEARSEFNRAGLWAS